MASIVISSTGRFVTMDGLRVMEWAGWTDQDQPCHLFILAIVPDNPRDLEAMQRNFGLDQVKRRLTREGNKNVPGTDSGRGADPGT